MNEYHSEYRLNIDIDPCFFSVSCPAKVILPSSGSTIKVSFRSQVPLKARASRADMLLGVKIVVP